MHQVERRGVRLKVLVTYYSETGNTEKIARAIYEEVSKEHEAYLKKINEVTADALNNYELVFLGSACHSADLAAPVKKILDAVPTSPRFKLAGFFTHSTLCSGDSARTQKLFDRWAGKCIVSFDKVSMEKRIDFKGYYHCQGVPSLPIQEFIKKEIIESADEWKGYIKEVRKHPSSEDVQEAKSFAREVLSKS
ncbi:flavodoxin domain-containing protein [Candidatus Bathyarchaeota archaeon]|nr:flavodoxin domain-containing protein [Candidatus Bathyarchaeota archaeon]